ncbi:MAG: HD domain-containing protein [Candidatus Thermoplasmatota archaeon]|nr:HD domain-containing protein [Candidatus Thermoplasmatota archaeon]
MSNEVQIILEAVQFAADRHGVQLRKEGLPYITHPITVANTLSKRGYGLEYIITALFHDLLEDTATTYEEIEQWCEYHLADPSFHRSIPDAVEVLTTGGKKDPQYFERIKGNDIARIVKLVDRLHNLTTMKGLSPEWQRKYIEETWRYVVPLTEGTEFKDEMTEILHKRENMLNYD